MTLNETILAKKSELAELKERIEANDAEAIEQGAALKAEIEEKETELKQAETKTALLNTIGEKSTTEETKMTELENFAQKASEMTDKKAGVSVHLKAATDVVTGVQLADIDRSVAPQPTRRASVHGDSPGQNTRVHCRALLQGIFLTRDQTWVFYVSCIGRRVLYH